MPLDAVKAIVDDTDRIMNNIENPNVSMFDIRGMVVGHVQSGKTGNYAGLICKAADAGYKFIVVISGTNINNLRDQTQKRLDNSFVGIHKGERSGYGKHEHLQGDKQPISLTSADKDFKRHDVVKNAGVLNLDNTTAPIFLVIKKNVTSLKNVIDWLNSLNKNSITQHAMLMVDDEADYASINYKDDNNPTKINERLRELLSLFKRSSYIGYTATPYANVFINHKAGNGKLGDDLFPRDFIYALGVPTNYFGAREVFLDDKRKYLISIDDYQYIIPPDHKKDFELPSMPKSLYEAMRVFVLNIAIRNLRGEGNKHNSMLIHATRFTAVHQKLASHVSQYVEKIKNEINAYGKLLDANRQSTLIQDFKNTLSNVHKDIGYSWQEVLSSLCDIIGTIVYKEVHQHKTSAPLEYRDNITTNAIVIGGASLSRGYTLEGLSVSYFLRNTKFYDTLMQMGRWFGYREGYQDLCRIYMPEIMIDNFGHIIEITEDLIDDFRRMESENMTPKDFGLTIKQHHGVLQITANNKQRSAQNTYIDINLDGRLKDTGWLSRDKIINKNNLSAIRNLVSKLVTKKINQELKKGKYVWINVDKDDIFNFINDFKIPKTIGVKERMPIDLIKEYVKSIKTKWDVVLYGGSQGEDFLATKEIVIQKEKRNTGVNVKGNQYEIRQISSGIAEAIVLSDEEKSRLGSDRKDIRAIRKKPLLILHVLETEFDKELAAFSISFPGGIKSKGRTIKAKMNTVEQERLLEEQSDD
ncbi:Endonuclease [Bathymodiolus thermophilus thioautotrophic gill symbiont]|nr:Endonuclease [Bathymodiolus thermophilus thioautotrophic gill symbiont]